MRAPIPVLASLALLAVPAGASQAGRPEIAELRAALDALRDGQPGQPAFEAALPSLPWLVTSGSGWFVAGGAFLAGQFGRRECIPALRSALAYEQNRSQAFDPTAKTALLDALIRLDAELPAEVLTRRLDCLAETFLLLRREPRRDAQALRALLDAAGDLEPTRWAAAATLAAQGDPGVAERLLAGTPWAIEVRVGDVGSQALEAVVQGGSIRCFSHAVWPPRVAYALQVSGSAPGAITVGFERRVGSRRLVLPPPLTRQRAQELRAGLLAQLADEGQRDDLPRPSEDLLLEGSGPEAFEGAVLAHLADLRRRLTRLAGLLGERGLLADPEAVVQRTLLQVSVLDLRSQSAVALPELPSQPGVRFERKSR